MNASEVGLSAARAMIAAAEQRAMELGVRAVIVVLDRSGDIVAVARMDGAWPGAFDLALGKAHASRSFHAPSAIFVPMIQPGQALFGIGNVNAGRYVILPGGFPVSADGRVLGAVGVSGGSTDQDCAVAEAALGALETA